VPRRLANAGIFDGFRSDWSCLLSARRDQNVSPVAATGTKANHGNHSRIDSDWRDVTKPYAT
jgi:hypothetical protein